MCLRCSRVTSVNLLADRQKRVEGRHRVLKDHGDLAAANLRQLPHAHPQQILPVIEGRPLGDDPRRLRNEPQEGQVRDALAAARFADDPQRLPGRQFKRHAIDRAHQAIVRLEVDVEVFDGEQRVSHVSFVNCQRQCRIVSRRYVQFDIDHT